MTHDFPRRAVVRSLSRAAFASSVCTLAVLATAPLAACGSRGPLDVDVIYVGADGATSTMPFDAGGASTAGETTGGGGATTGGGGGATTGGGSGSRDAGRDGATSPIACGTCLFQKCGTDIAACLADTTCRTVLQCAVTTCLGGAGGLNPTCALTCAQGNTGVLLKLVGVFTCITQQCGADCTSVLTGGIPGLPGGTTGGRGGFRDESDAPSAKRQAFSAWPELASHL